MTSISHESLESLREQKALLQGLASSDSASSLREPIHERTLNDSNAGSQSSLARTIGTTAELKAYTSKSPGSPALTTSTLETTRDGKVDLPDNNALPTSSDKINIRRSLRRFDRNVLSLYRKDLEQHAALVNKLLAEVSSPALVDLDLGIRDRVEKGILAQHLEEWSTLLKNVGLGVDPFLPFLEKYPRLVG
jgi:hypothetical protein